MSAASMISEIRMRRGLSMNALAGLAGVPASTVSRIESGVIEPTFALVGRLASAAGFRLDAGVVESGSDEPIATVLRRLADEPGRTRSILATFPTVAGLAPVARRSGVRRVELAAGLRDVLGALTVEGAGPVLSSLEAFSADTETQRSFVPIVYVADPAAVRSLPDAQRGSARVGLLVPLTDNVREFTRVVDGMVMMRPLWGLLDALASPGRQADVALGALDALRVDRLAEAA